MKLLLIPLLLLAGCTAPQPPDDMVLIGTMSIYRTERGMLVIHDQTHEAMQMEFNLRTVVIKKK